MLARYIKGEDISTEDFDDLCDLINKHPDHVKRIGTEILRIYRDTTKHGPNCFWIEGKDRTKAKDDCSIKNALMQQEIPK